MIGNWHQTDSFTVAGHTIPPKGFLVDRQDDYFMAGVFSEFNGRALPNAPHTLVVSGAGAQLNIRQLAGSDTWLDISVPSLWQSSHSIVLRAVDKQGNALYEESVEINEGQISFSYEATAAETAVSHYQLYNPNLQNIFLPVISASN